MYGNMIKQSIGVIALMITLLAVSSCDKVSPTGVLVGGSGTDDRVKMSVEYFKNHLQEDLGAVVDSDQYSFLVGSDSHIATDTCRMAEMLQNGLVMIRRPPRSTLYLDATLLRSR